MSHDTGTTYRTLPPCEAQLYKTADPARLSDLTALRLDLRAADVSHIEFVNCQVSTLLVDETTRFGQTWPCTPSLEVHSGRGIEILRTPADQEKWLVRRSSRVEGTGSAVSCNSEAIKLLDWVCRRSLRQHYIKLHPDDVVGSTLVNNALWNSIQEVLEKHNRVRRKENLGTSGAPGTFIHLVSPKAILENDESDPVARAIRVEVESIPT